MVLSPPTETGYHPSYSGPGTQPDSFANYPTSSPPRASGLNGGGSTTSSSPGYQLIDPVAYQNYQNQQQLGLGQLGINTALTQSSQQYLRDQNALGLQGLDLKRQGTNLDRNDIDAQLANIGINREIAGKMLANQLKDFGINRTESWQGAQRNQFGLKSDLTARGAFMTPALDRGMGRIGEDLANQLGHIGTGETGAKLGYQREMSGYDLATSNAKNRAKGLDLAMQQYGLDEKGLNLTLNNGLKQLGLQGIMDATQILGALGSGNQQYMGVVNSMLQLMGLPPLNMTPAASGTSGGGAPSSTGHGFTGPG